MSEESSISFGLRPVVKRLRAERDEITTAHNKITALEARIAELEADRATLPRPALCEAMVLVEETLRIKDGLGYRAWTTEHDYETIDGVEDEYCEWADTGKGSDHEVLELCDLIARSVMRLARLGKVGYHDGRGRAKVTNDGA